MTSVPSSVRPRPYAFLLCAVALGAGMLSSPVFGVDLPGVATYRGVHPLFPHTGGFCYIDVTHVHKKRPSDLRVYRVLPNDEYLFVGDPVALGYVGPTTAYFGPHPLDLGVASPATKIFCYIRGPHFHGTESPPTRSFISKAGVYWFMEAFPPEFGRDRRYLWINDSGAIATYQPPVVSIADAPDGYRFPAEAHIEATETPTAIKAPAPGKAPANVSATRAKVGSGSSAKAKSR